MSLYGIFNYTTPQVTKGFNELVHGTKNAMLNFLSGQGLDRAPEAYRQDVLRIVREWTEANLTHPSIQWQPNQKWEIGLYHPAIHKSASEGFQMKNVDHETLKPLANALRKVIQNPSPYIDRGFIRDLPTLEKYDAYATTIQNFMNTPAGKRLADLDTRMKISENSQLHVKINGHLSFGPMNIEDSFNLESILAQLADTADAVISGNTASGRPKPSVTPTVTEPLHPLHPNLIASAYPHTGGGYTGGHTPIELQPLRQPGATPPPQQVYYTPNVTHYTATHQPPYTPPVSQFPLSPPPAPPSAPPPVRQTVKTPEPTAPTPEPESVKEPVPPKPAKKPQEPSVEPDENTTDIESEPDVGEADATETMPRPLPGKIGASTTSALQSFKAALPEVKEFTNEKPDLPVRPTIPGLSMDALKRRKKLALGLYKVEKDKDKAHRLASYMNLTKINTTVQQLFNAAKDKNASSDEAFIKMILEHTNGATTTLTIPNYATNGGLQHYAAQVADELGTLRKRQNSDLSKKEDYEALIKFASELEAYIDNAQTYLGYKLKSGSALEDKKAEHYKKQYDKLHSSYKNKIEELKTAYRYEKELPDAASYLDFRKDELDNEFSKGVEKITDWMPAGKTMPAHAQDKHTIDVAWKKFQEEQGLVPETVKDNVDYFKGVAATAATTLPFYALGVPLGPFGLPLAVGSFVWGSNPAARNFVSKLREGDPRGMLNEFTKFLASNYDYARENFTEAKKDPKYEPLLKHYETSPFKLAQNAAGQQATHEEIVQAVLNVIPHKGDLVTSINQSFYDAATRPPGTPAAALRDAELASVAQLLAGTNDVGKISGHVDDLLKSLTRKLENCLTEQGVTDPITKANDVKNFLKDPNKHLTSTTTRLTALGRRDVINDSTEIRKALFEMETRLELFEASFRGFLPTGFNRGHFGNFQVIADHPWSDLELTNQEKKVAWRDFKKAYDQFKALESTRESLQKQRNLLEVLKETKKLKETVDKAQQAPSS